MKVGCYEKNLPVQLELIDKENGIFNLWVPGALNIKAIKAILKNPPEDCHFITIFGDNDRWKNMIEHLSKELEMKYYRFERNDNFVHYIVPVNGYDIGEIE